MREKEYVERFFVRVRGQKISCYWPLDRLEKSPKLLGHEIAKSGDSGDLTGGHMGGTRSYRCLYQYPRRKHYGKNIDIF
jgi:hypothetical protein